jgi:hypothetical protein
LKVRREIWYDYETQDPYYSASFGPNERSLTRNPSLIWTELQDDITEDHEMNGGANDEAKLCISSIADTALPIISHPSETDLSEHQSNPTMPSGQGGLAKSYLPIPDITISRIEEGGMLTTTLPTSDKKPLDVNTISDLRHQMHHGLVSVLKALFQLLASQST